MTYINSLTRVTCVMVSHDQGLLSKVCTDMIEIHELKLDYYKGNLDAFLKSKPDAKVYFELAEKGKIDFNFPSPGAPKAQLNNVTITLCLASRVACVGENGAGKSTMIKLLTGELEPDAGSGEVWKHPNCRVGYIAQHAFHHIEKHLDETANDYIRWRYANGGDREETVKVTFVNTPEEIKAMETAFELQFTNEDGSVRKAKYIVERFTERRRDNKANRKQEYECQMKGSEALIWVDREILCKNGWEKTLKQLDERIALRATQFALPLTKE